MQNEILASLARLSDNELAAQVKRLAARERDAAARMIAHLAEMDTRDIHLREGYPRLYDYCLQVLHLSEWEAWNRIEVGRVARRFPVIFDMLEEGSIHLTGVKLLAPHLTPENHRDVLESARWKSKLAIGEIVARLHPLPDVPTSVVPIPAFAVVSDPPPAATSIPAPSDSQAPATAPAPSYATPPPPPAGPATLTPLSPRRYKLQLTISDETLEKLRRAKDMLGHSVPAGDDDAVLNRALTVLLDKLAREKFAQTDKPRPGRPRKPRARRPSASIRRIVWERDGGRCKYISPDGHRCEETRRIETHHLDPWVLAGDADTPDAYELRCQRHNDYEGRLYFGKRRRGDDAGRVRERPTLADERATITGEQQAIPKGYRWSDLAKPAIVDHDLEQAAQLRPAREVAAEDPRSRCGGGPGQRLVRRRRRRDGAAGAPARVRRPHAAPVADRDLLRAGREGERAVLRSQAGRGLRQPPRPHVLAEEIAEDLRDALGQIESVLADLKARIR